jgi:ABC-type Fe3+ transport system substrate-binding protein
VVRLPLSGDSPELIRAWEEGFQQRFGFPVILESEPGHPQRDIPVKVDRAAEAGQGVVDADIHGTAVLPYPLFKKGLLRQPPWEALYSEWPFLQTARSDAPEWGGGPPGVTMRDYCVTDSHGIWSLNYNKRNVTPDELTDLTWYDLTTDKWKGRLGFDERALGLFMFPVAPGWDEERLRVFAHNLGANGLKLITGGTRNINTAILQGEVDIGFASPDMENIQQGAPVDFTVAEFIVGPGPSVTCLPKHGVNDPDMATLYWAWKIAEGSLIESEVSGTGGWLYPEVADKFPLMQRLKALGATPDQVVYPRTPEQAETTEKWRQIAIDAQLEGIRTGQKLEYNYPRK